MLEVTIPYGDVHELLALGDFAGAITALGPQWRGPGVIPSRDGHDNRSYASLLMACGVLTAEFGLMGSRLQERSKDMLSKSERLFGDNLAGAQAARAWLGIAYDRCGDFNEALAIADSLLQSKDSSLEVMVCAAKTKAIALDGLGLPQEALASLDDILPVVGAMPPLLQGKVYLQRGITLRRLERYDDALDAYDLAMECFHSAGSSRYEAAASNNIGTVYLYLNEFTRAHILTEKAVRLFKGIGDRNHEGMAWDQIAQIYRREGKYHEAERAVLRAIALLEPGDHTDFLAEALTTHGMILIEIGMSAVVPLQKAAAIYENQNNPVQLKAVTATMWDSVARIKALAKASIVAMRPIERRRIEQVLTEHHGHLSPSARDLGMTPRGLKEKIKLHFPDLIEKCQPMKKRKRSIIKKR